MFKSLACALTLSALMAVPTASHALVFTFNAALAGFKEVPANAATATGTAILDYDDKDTLTLADDTYNFALSVFGLTGVATGFHIHGAGSTTENGPVRVNLANAPFVNFNAGGTLLVGGNTVAAPVALFSNGPYVNLSLLDMLRNGLSYVNVHTTNFGGGEVRGQLIEVSVVPEPSTYAMFAAGLGVVGLLWRRQRSRQA